MTIDIPVFVISLPEAKARRESMSRRLHELGIPFRFFDAIDGRGFDMDIHPSYNGRKRRRYFGKDLTGGEMGCLLSHRSIYERIVRDGISEALIFEDDVIIDDEFPVVVSALLKQRLPYELVRFLGSEKVARLRQRAVHSITGVYTLNRLCTTPGGAHAYLIRLEGARKLVRHTQKNWLPIDTLMGHVWQTGVDAYIVQPGIARHNLALESYIGETRFDKKQKPNPVNRAVFKIGEGLMKRLSYWALAAQDYFSARRDDEHATRGGS